jgi:hypothetical protein
LQFQNPRLRGDCGEWISCVADGRCGIKLIVSVNTEDLLGIVVI